MNKKQFFNKHRHVLALLSSSYKAEFHKSGKMVSQGIHFVAKNGEFHVVGPLLKIRNSIVRAQQELYFDSYNGVDKIRQTGKKINDDYFYKTYEIAKEKYNADVSIYSILWEFMIEDIKLILKKELDELPLADFGFGGYESFYIYPLGFNGLKKLRISSHPEYSYFESDLDISYADIFEKLEEIKKYLESFSKNRT